MKNALITAIAFLLGFIVGVYSDPMLDRPNNPRSEALGR